MISDNTHQQLHECRKILNKCGLHLTWRERLRIDQIEDTYDLLIHINPLVELQDISVINGVNKDEFAIAVNSIHYALTKINEASYPQKYSEDVVTQLKNFQYAGEDVQVAITGPKILTESTPDFFEIMMGPYFKATNYLKDQGENPARSVAPDGQ